METSKKEMINTVSLTINLFGVIEYNRVLIDTNPSF